MDTLAQVVGYTVLIWLAVYLLIRTGDVIVDIFHYIGRRRPRS